MTYFLALACMKGMLSVNCRTTYKAKNSLVSSSVQIHGQFFCDYKTGSGRGEGICWLYGEAEEVNSGEDDIF